MAKKKKNDYSFYDFFSGEKVTEMLIIAAILSFVLPSSIVIGYLAGTLGYSVYKFFKRNKNKKKNTKPKTSKKTVDHTDEEEFEAPLNIKSEIQEQFNALEEIISSHYDAFKKHKNLAFQDVFIQLNQLSKVVENKLNMTNKVVYTSKELKSSNITFAKQEDWVPIAEDLRKMNVIISDRYLKKILENPELFDDEESKILDIVESINTVLTSIDKKNQDISKYDTVVEEDVINSILSKNSIESVFIENKEKNSKTM